MAQCGKYVHGYNTPDRDRPGEEKFVELRTAYPCAVNIPDGQATHDGPCACSEQQQTVQARARWLKDNAQKTADQRHFDSGLGLGQGRAVTFAEHIGDETTGAPHPSQGVECPLCPERPMAKDLSQHLRTDHQATGPVEHQATGLQEIQDPYRERVAPPVPSNPYLAAASRSVNRGPNPIGQPDPNAYIPPGTEGSPQPDRMGDSGSGWDAVRDSVEQELPAAESRNTDPEVQAQLDEESLWLHCQYHNVSFPSSKYREHCTVLHDAEYITVTPIPAPTKANRAGDQQLPEQNDRPVMHKVLIDMLQERLSVGIERYGTGLQPMNGRDAERDLVEELVDASVYALQLRYERGEMAAHAQALSAFLGTLALHHNHLVPEEIVSHVSQLVTWLKDPIRG